MGGYGADHVRCYGVSEEKDTILSFVILTKLDSNMIDVSHPGNIEFNIRSTRKNASSEEPASATDEAAWLENIQAASGGDITSIKGLKSGSLVLDTSHLRDEPLTSAPRQASKGKLPA